MMPPQITTWKDWAELFIGWLLATFLTAFISAAGRDRIPFGERVGIALLDLRTWLSVLRRKMRRPRSRPIHEWLSPPGTFEFTIPAAETSKLKPGLYHLAVEGLAARVAASKTAFFNVPRFGIRERLAKLIGDLAARLQAWLAPKRAAEPELAKTIVPPASHWPSCMGIGIGALHKARRDSQLANARFVRLTTTISNGGAPVVHLEGKHDHDSPWVKISPVPPSQGGDFATSLMPESWRLPPGPRAGTS